MRTTICPPSARWSTILFFYGVFLSCLSSGCARSAAAEEETPAPAPVKAVAPRMISMGQWTELLGATQALPGRVARVSAPVEGRVLTVLQDAKGKPVAEGQRVSAGDVIAQLDTRIIQANREEAQATLRDLEEQSKQADFAVESAQLEFQRMQKTAVSLGREAELDRARFTFKDAESKKKGAVAKLEAGKAKLRVLDEQVELSTIRAPIAGQLGLVQAALGQTLAIGAPIAEVIDLDQIDVLCFVPPHAAGRLALGQPARIATGDGTGGPMGSIVFIAVQAQETGNFAVKARFPNRDLRLRANAIVSVQVLTQPEKERTTIPEAALMEDQDPPGVVVIEGLKTETNKDGKEEKLGKARRLRAVLGVRDRNWNVVEILRLEDSEKKESIPLQDALIIVEGGHGLHDDDAVKLEEEED